MESFGGRYDESCPMCDEDIDCTFGQEDCVCSYVGEYCFSQYNKYHLYDIFWVSAFLIHLYLLYLSGFFFWEIFKRKAIACCPNCLPSCCLDEGSSGSSRPISGRIRSKRRFSAMESIIILTFTGCALRFTWVVSIVNGRNSSSVMVSPPVESILLKINLFNIILICVLVPTYVVGNLHYPYLVWWVDYILMGCVFATFLMGVRFGWQLINQLETSILADTLIPTIKYVLRVSSIGTWIVIICSLLYNLYLRGRSEWFALGYATFVHHIAEPLLITALLRTRRDAHKRTQATKKRESKHLSQGGIGARAMSSRSTFKGGSFRTSSAKIPAGSMKFTEMRSECETIKEGEGRGVQATSKTSSNQQQRKMSKREVAEERMRKLELGKESVPRSATSALL
ncbi:hypothetical protein TrRE_jg9281 [Triparma retinervis]|uniref:Uncharacterized protein n=1 Tax=Triparma retinervis TaxID=2557542 RepID=A0A9W7DWS8_9STRA|nr:hypothetical protein TrRE_jg9281 [Triparma retinervis]